MKKLGKKVSFLTKILLVVGLLISNLSSLTAVFASEITEMVEVVLTDDSLNIKYLDTLAEDVETINVNVYENYTYLDGTNYYVSEDAEEAGKLTEYNLDLTGIETLTLGGLTHSSILTGNDPAVVEPIELFDGLYEVKVEITDANDEVIDSALYSKKFEYKDGLKITVIGSDATEIVPVNGKYLVNEENPEIKVVAQLLAGGLSPTDMFVYNEKEYMAYDLITEEVFASEKDYSGLLYGDYKFPVKVELEKPKLVVVSEEGDAELPVEPETEITEDDNVLVYSTELNVLYGAYQLNDDIMNQAAIVNGLGDSYLFYGNRVDGNVYALLDLTNPEVKTMFDLYTIVDSAVEGVEKITYKLSNGEHEDVLADHATEIPLEDYLKAIELDETTTLSLTSEGLTITYKVVVLGDLNGDNAITSDDLLELVNQVVGVSEVTLNKSDLFKLDGKVNTLDVMYLREVINSNDWSVMLTESEEVTLDAKLEVEEKELYSGDEFTVSYVLSLTDYEVNGVTGLFGYDKDLLELVSVKSDLDWTGATKDGKFLYLGENSLVGPELPVVPETTEQTPVNNENPTETPEVEPVSYVVVTAKFKALKAGTSVVTVKDIELVNGAEYLILDNNTVSSDEIVVNASNNNNLSSLTVAGQTIELVEDVLEYEITVTNDVTTLELLYELENVAAKVTSVIYPEELAEGENAVSITVEAETGDVKVYTVTVIREASEEEEVVTQIVYDNYDNDYEKDDEVVTPEPEEDEEVVDNTEKEESNLSRIIIIILILLVIAGLVYLIFKDEDDEETKKTNKEINKLKKEDKELNVKTTEKVVSKPKTKANSSKKNNVSKNKKKER